MCAQILGQLPLARAAVADIPGDRRRQAARQRGAQIIAVGQRLDGQPLSLGQLAYLGRDLLARTDRQEH